MVYLKLLNLENNKIYLQVVIPIDINKSISRLMKYCESQEFKGWDPYDGLNSKLFYFIPLISNNSFIRLCWIQLFKRSPINFRRICLVEKDYNPKGLGLFLSGYCNLYSIEHKNEYLTRIDWLIKKIFSLESKGWSGSCWGYNFPWQAKAFFQPKYTPSIVVSAFVGCALLDAYDVSSQQHLLKKACSTCDFILKNLNRTYDEDKNFSFSYSPLDTTQVFNASLLGAKLLARVYSYTKEFHLIKEAKKVVGYCAHYQNDDGSWVYSPLSFHKWIDSFHTGYNLECMTAYQKYSGDKTYESNIEKGLNYYLYNFFTDKGEAKYYSDKVYPIDIHATAQLIITLSRLNKFKECKELIDKVLTWTIQNMQSPKGYFYYQIKKIFNLKIPYMRWGQAWMFYSLSLYMRECLENEK